MSNSFYIVVTSDASTAQYKPAKFKMQLLNQQHLSEDWEVAMTHIIYPHTWENVHSQQLSYELSCNSDSPWTLPIYLPSGIYRTIDDVVSGMVTGLQSAFPDIYLKSGKRFKRIGGADCFYIYSKAQHYHEFKLPQTFQVTLLKNLARTLGYLNHHDRVPALYQISDIRSDQIRSVISDQIRSDPSN